MLMEKMHHASNSVVAKAILVLIGASFVVTGMYGYLGASADTFALKINGEEISQQRFQQQYNQEYQRSSDILGAKFAEVANTPEFIQNITDTTLNHLIEQELLTQYINELKLTVSDERIKQEIVQTPIFQVDGKFSNEAYQLVLRNNNMTPDMYAEYMRQILRLQQLQQGLAGSVSLMPTSQNEFANLFFQQRKVRFAQLPLVNEIAQQQVTEQEIQEYYAANPSTFIEPEQVKVQYIDLTKQSLEKQIVVGDKEIAQYYQDNKSQFTTNGLQHLAHIQLATETEALDIYQALQNGADFAELAKTKSADKFSGAEGGDLGWLNNGDLPKDFEDAATLVEVGKYSTPIKVDNNYHIILVKERKNPEIKPLEQVKDQIAQQVRQELLNNLFYSVEKKLAEKSFEDQSSLKSAAEATGLELKETGYFSRNQIPQQLDFPAVINNMFNGEISQGNINSEPMNVAEQHSIVVRVLEHKPEAKRSLEQAKTDIENLLKRQKAESAVLAKATEAIKPLNEGADEKLSNGLTFGETEQWVYAENKDPLLNNIIFSMKLRENGSTSYQVAQNANGDVLIIALDNIENAKVEDMIRTQFNTQVLQGKVMDLQINLIAALRAKAKIDINQNFIKQSTSQ